MILKGETDHREIGQDGVILQAAENIGPAGQVVIPSSLRVPLLTFLFC